MRASRLLSLLLLLQNRGRMTAPALARELEVSVRTVYRDVESLSAAGIPVYADRGPAGGYRLLDGYRTRLTGMTGAEADSLLLAGLPAAATELGLGAEMAAAQLKLLAALPAELRDRAERVHQRFHLDTTGWFREPDDAPHLAALAAAVWSQSRVRVRYRRWGGQDTQRCLDPLGVVLKGGQWYLIAQSSPGGAEDADPPTRTYRVSRVSAAQETGEVFQRPRGFGLAAYWRAWTQEFERSIFTGHALVRLSPRGLGLLQDLADPITARAARENAEEADTEGWVRVRLPLESLDISELDFARLGADVEVLEPAELRERMAAAARRMARLYTEPGGGATPPDRSRAG